MQKINPSEKLHTVNRLGLGNDKEIDKIDHETKNKTKVDFIIGVFFDGTGNNRFNSDLVYYKHLDKNNNVIENQYKKTKVKGKKKDFMVDTDSSYWNPYSNIVLLHDLYKIGLDETKNSNTKKTYYIRQYVQGIGTLEEEEDDTLGSGFGVHNRGVIGKVQEACEKISNQLSDIFNTNKNYTIGSLTFDVYGFSRGAASARHFCNEVIGIDSKITNFGNQKDSNSIKKIVKIDNTRVSLKNNKLPISQTYTLGMLGDEFKKKKIYYKYTDSFSSSEDNEKVKIRFLGLFDTVVSQFISKYYGDFNLDKLKEYNELVKVKNLQKANVDISKLDIKRVLHLTADDEWRENFPSTSANKGITIRVLGAHSDIGGGYAALQKENTKIHLFKVETGTNEDEINNPKIGKKEIELQKFFIKNGFCKQNEIKFKKIGEITKKVKINNLETSVVNGVVLRLESEKIIKPRYSTVPLSIMKEISQKAGVPFVKDIGEIKNKESETKPKPFEYEVPKDLKNYLKIVSENANEDYEKLYNKKIIKAKSKLTTEIVHKIRHEFVHLSSNFNKPAFKLPVIVKKYNYEVVYNPNEEEFINKMAYINHPRMSNKISKPYEREILSP
ncbi:phospholipase effector Tle1 domain-containing protein [Flavobacterium terrigena]|uniref:Uncharacterized alpha/beta hydrolase domain n=1 Tax=Flavobacterium terrigena TaxID=402734 RepID=A0A1H6SG43_9FLAO|nr:DUF2235 domain-containing protein [Flavobacterium terrigena]SEI63777.1 Uncharacterized alpha/beta hydrolase domain [Flavobacterium terrigena]